MKEIVISLATISASSVLGFAGAAKIHSVTSQIRDFGIDALSVGAMLLAVLEVALAIWLLVSSDRFAAWCVALTTFACFLIYRVATHETTTECGCLGRVSFAGHWMTGIVGWLTVCAITGVVFTWRKGGAEPWHRGIAESAGFAAITISVLVGLTYFRVERIWNERALETSQLVLVVDAYNTEAGEVRATIDLKNVSNRTLTILNWKPSCGIHCEMPKRLLAHPGERHRLTIYSRAKRDAGLLQVPLSFYVDKEGRLFEESVRVRLRMPESCEKI